MKDVTVSAAYQPSVKQLIGRGLQLVGVWFSLEVALLGVTFGWVAFHSHVVDPGRATSHYEQYAQQVSPRIALVLSAPVFALLGFLCSRRMRADGVRFALQATLLYLAVDAAIVALVAGAELRAWGIWIAATVLKLVGLRLGGRLGAQRSPART